MNLLHKFISNRVRAIMASRPPDFVEDPYMLRWWLIPRNRFFNIYLHHILHDDKDRALHDHPWASLSYIISGKLVEHYKKIYPTYHWIKWVQKSRVLKARQWVYRSATFVHRLILVSDTATTLFMTGPTVRSWGFHCPQGWVPWQDFVSPDDKGAVGRGCGETKN